METTREIAQNLFILTVYLIVVMLVLNQALRSIENLITIEPDWESINQQLEDNNLKDIINLKFIFAESYKLDELKTILITLENKSKESFIEIDWKQCFISDFDKRIRQAVRVIPGTTDISQTASKIPPGQTLKEQVSDEKVAAPLFEPKKLKAAAQKADTFFLRLPLKISEPASDARSCNLRCHFIAKTLPWQRAFTLALQPK